MIGSAVQLYGESRNGKTLYDIADFKDVTEARVGSLGHAPSWNDVPAIRIVQPLTGFVTEDGHVFDLRRTSMTITEYARDGDTVMCAAFANQAPGLRMEVRIARIPDE